MASDAVHGILDKVLAFVDKPWKAVTVIIVLLIGGLLYIVYLQRAELTALLTYKYERVAPQLQPAKYAYETGHLMSRVDADSISVASIDMVTNTIAIRYSRGRGDILPLKPTPRPVIVTDEDASLFLSLFQLRYNCFDPNNLPNRPEAVEDVARGINRVCLVMIPPTPPLALGVLIVGWKVALAPVRERDAVLAIQGTAERIAIW